MNQDTRKDKRAKVVSLNVRYKSATVDEFIENHSHDVSRGGIFVKTPTPFAPGTLLKFEIRLAGDKSVISGVGRVVWKREPPQASTDRPAGMGVKFIKVDDASRSVIDRLVAEKVNAGSAYMSEPAALDDDGQGQGTLRGLSAVPPADPALSLPPAMSIRPSGPAPAPTSKAPPAAASGSILPKATGSRPGTASLAPKTMPYATSSPGTASPKVVVGATGGPASRTGGPPPPMAHRPATAIGMGPPAPQLPVPAPASEPNTGAPVARRPPPASSRKATMLGVAPAPSGASDVSSHSTPPAGLGGGAKYDTPTRNVDFAPVPLGEITKGAADAGSSVSALPEPPSTSVAPAPMFPKLENDPSPFESVKEPTVMKQAAELLEEALREAGGSLEEIGQNPLFSQSSQRGDKVEELAPASLAKTHDPSTPLTLDPISKPQPALSSPALEPAMPKSAPVPSATPAPASAVAQITGADKKKGGAGALVAGLFVAVAVVGGGAYAYMSGALSGVLGSPVATPTAPAPSASASDQAAADADAPTEAAEAGAAAVAVEASDAGVAAVVAAADASVTSAADAGATRAVAPTPAVPTPKAFVKPKPKPAPTPETNPDAPPPKPAPEPAPETKPTAEPKPEATAEPKPAPETKASPEPKPAPEPKTEPKPAPEPKPTPAPEL